jgi:hypothetical protein
MTNKPESFDPSIPTLTDVVVPGKPEYARAAAANVALEYDASQVVERVRGRVSEFLQGDAHALIAARCEEVLREHSATLVQALSREVTAALEGRMQVWIGEAVDEELRRQREA